MRMIQFAFLLLVLLGGAVADEEPKPEDKLVECGLPDFSFNMMVFDDDIDLVGFQKALVEVTTTHLNELLVEKLSSSTSDILSSTYFDEVLLESKVLRTFLGEDSSMTNSSQAVSRIQVSFDGTAEFSVPFHAKSRVTPKEESAIHAQVAGAFQGPWRSKLLERFEAHEQLQVIISLQVQVDDIAIFVESKDEDKSGMRLITSASVLLAVSAVAIVAMLVHMRRQQRTQKPACHSTESKMATPTERVESDSDDEHDGDDMSLDEWSEKLTSIPVRKNTRPIPTKRILPRPARRQSRKNWLGCIAEEDGAAEPVVHVGDTDAEMV